MTAQFWYRIDAKKKKKDNTWMCLHACLCMWAAKSSLQYSLPTRVLFYFNKRLLHQLFCEVGVDCKFHPLSKHFLYNRDWS